MATREKTEHQSNKKASSRKWHKKVADPAIKKHAITWRLWTHIETAEVKKKYSTGQRTTTKKKKQESADDDEHKERTRTT